MSDSHQKLFEGYEKGPDQKWTIPNDEESGVYRFILAAARRARQLQKGQRPLIKTTLRKSTKIAMEEIRTGAVKVEIIPEGQPWPQPGAFDATTDGSADALDPLTTDLGTGSRPGTVSGGPGSPADIWPGASEAKSETPVVYREEKKREMPVAYREE